MTEGRALLGTAIALTPSWSRRRGRRCGAGGTRTVTRLSLKNPIAILMICIGVVVFAAVVTPRMSVDTFPELTPPVLVVGRWRRASARRTWRRQSPGASRSTSARRPGVDHVQSMSRNNLSVVFVWLKWGTDLNSAQTLVQQQVAFAMAAVPKSLGVLPPFVLQYDPSNAPVIQVAVSGRRSHRAAALRLRAQQHRADPRGHPRRGQRVVNGGRQRQINMVVDPRAPRRAASPRRDVAAAVAQSNALLPSGEFISPKFDANVYTNAVARRVADIGDAVVKQRTATPVLIRDVARVEDGGSPETQAVAVNGKTPSTSTCCASRAATRWRSSTPSRRR